MKKYIAFLLAAALLSLAACQQDTASTESKKEPVISEDSALSSSEDTSVEYSSMEESSVYEVSESSEESSAEVYVPTPEEICREISAINSKEFGTNIKNGAAEELEALKAYLVQSGYGFFYCDLEYNAYISYGCERKFKTASTIKLPYIKHLATRVDAGEVDLNEKLLYDSAYYDGGSGVLKNVVPGGYYNVRTLMDYVLRYSDNIAYKMLFKAFGLKGFVEDVAALGVDFQTHNGYGECTAAEMGAMLYDCALYEGGCLELMKEAGCNASYNYQIGAELKEYTVFQKYGVITPGNVAYHDMAIVYAPHPYIMVIYTDIDYKSADKNAPFRTIARMVDDINKALYGNQ